MLDAPPGTWLHRTDAGFELGATTRNPIAVVVVPFCIVFSCSLVGSVISVVEREDLSLGLSLILLAIVSLTVLLGIAASLMVTCGQIIIEVHGDNGVLFEGVGRTGRRRRFTWSDVEEIRLVEKRTSKGGKTKRVLLGGNGEIEFGTGLTDRRRDFVVRVLQERRREYGAR